jgi:hypothetical protein
MKQLHENTACPPLTVRVNASRAVGNPFRNEQIPYSVKSPSTRHNDDILTKQIGQECSNPY